jgi:endonuclease/exonuclease/phosphatase family metal-dependent hydrolase
VRVLTWNLFHGRSQPPSRHALLDEFATTLAGWEWDVALLQEVLPWWPPVLAAVAGADQRTVLTSRNQLLPVRRAVAVRNPELIKSGAGGANAILVRGDTILEHHTHRLRLRPERRCAHGVRLAAGGWVINLHAHVRPASLAWSDAIEALAAARRWSSGAPFVFGGDLNLKHPAFTGMRHVAGHYVDHVFTDGRAAAGPADVLDRGHLSDHAPVAVTLA